MGSIFDKLEFTLEAVNKITEALKEVTYENIDALNLSEYADVIKRMASTGDTAISTLNMISRYNYSYPILRLESNYKEAKYSPKVMEIKTFVNIYPSHISNHEYTEVTI